MPIQETNHRRKKRRQSDKESTEQNKAYATIAKAAIEQSAPQQTRPPLAITLTNNTHLKIAALVLQTYIASLQNPKQYEILVL